MSRYKEIDLSRIKTLSLADRDSKVEAGQLATPISDDSSFRSFWESLPKMLAAKDLHNLVYDLISARKNDKKVIVMMGAHVIKVGLTPILIDWMRRGRIHCLAVNGACAIHDSELAFYGKTSEDVAEFIKDGRFGMSKETAAILNETVSQGVKDNLGFGEAIGRFIVEKDAPNGELSLLGEAYRLGIPVTVHVGLGTDIVHQHPNADGAAIGEASLRDFRIFSDRIRGIHDGGAAMLFGSSVILPEVFLKALTVARNVAGPVEGFITANFDMIQHYRPRVNVLKRPTQDSGKFYQFTGHHEIMIPLLSAAWNETDR
ncbi:hypothetical protein KAR48_10340 [bacterium]|nr:hypothetical protein [bacterium]